MSGIELFLASSSEGRRTARDLRDRLPRDWGIQLWDESAMLPGHSAWNSLIGVGTTVDGAVMVITGDDVVEHRGQKQLAPRDNVIFECGLFMGMLGPERTLLVQARELDVRLPSDLEGITRIRYDRPASADDERDAVDAAAREIERSIARLGRRVHDVPPAADHRRALDDELDKLCRAARARGWAIVTESSSVVRLRYAGTKDVELRVPLGDPLRARQELRHVALALHKLGVRVARDLLPVTAQPHANNTER